MNFDPTKVHPSIAYAIGTWEGFRKLGFKAEELFAHFDPSQNIVFMVLITQGTRFSVKIGPYDRTRADFEEEYRETAEAVNANKVPPEILDSWWQESEVYQRKVDFGMALLAKGIKVPGP